MMKEVHRMGLFDSFRKKHSEKAAPSAPSSVAVEAKDDTLYAPVGGRAVKMTDVPDPLFGSEGMGKGCAIWPDDETVYAPADGTITVAMPHAIGLTTADGIEVLIHVGIDTVEMNGDGFTSYAKQGDTVHAGDALLTIDREKIKAADHPDCVVLIVSNTADFAGVSMLVDPGSQVKAGTAVVGIER